MRLGETALLPLVLLDILLFLPINLGVRPIKVLRRFLQQNPETNEFSSQLGLALLVDRSESLVRAIEGGRMKMSLKFAKAISSKTGASKKWLMLSDVDSMEVPSERGDLLTHSEVVARVRQEIKSNLDDVVDTLIDSGSQMEHVGVGNIQRQMAVNMAKLVEVALCESINRGDTELMEQITRLLAKHGGGKE